MRVWGSSFLSARGPARPRRRCCCRCARGRGGEARVRAPAPARDASLSIRSGARAYPRCEPRLDVAPCGEAPERPPPREPPRGRARAPMLLELRERKRGRSARQSAGERPGSLERARARVPEVEGRDAGVGELRSEGLRARGADVVAAAREEEGEKRASERRRETRLSRARARAYTRSSVFCALRGTSRTNILNRAFLMPTPPSPSSAACAADVKLRDASSTRASSAPSCGRERGSRARTRALDRESGARDGARDDRARARARGGVEQQRSSRRRALRRRGDARATP